MVLRTAPSDSAAALQDFAARQNGTRVLFKRESAVLSGGACWAVVKTTDRQIGYAPTASFSHCSASDTWDLGSSVCPGGKGMLVARLLAPCSAHSTNHPDT